MKGGRGERKMKRDGEKGNFGDLVEIVKFDCPRC